MNWGSIRICLEFSADWYNAAVTLVEITYELQSPLTEGQLRLLQDECRLRNVRFSDCVRLTTLEAVRHVKNRLAY